MEPGLGNKKIMKKECILLFWIIAGLFSVGLVSADNFTIVNVTNISDPYLGTEKSNLLIGMSLFIVICFMLMFSTKLAGAGLFLAAVATGLFGLMGWLPIRGIHLVAVYLIAFIYFVTKRRFVN